MNLTLMQWGTIQFQVWPLNYHEMDHQTGTAYARKEVLQSIPQREWVGEDDEEITIRGKLFPSRVGGLAEIEAFDKMRRDASAHILVRGSTEGFVLGWFVCERLNRRHTYVGNQGFGRVIEFDALFSRCDTPDPANYYYQLSSAFLGSGG